MILTVKIFATLAVLGLAFGLFTETQLDTTTIVLYIVMLVLAWAGIWI